MLILYKEKKKIGGDKKVDEAIIDSYGPIKKEYSQLPYFDDFIRAIPESILDFEKTISLSPKVAQEVVWYLIETLKKEKITLNTIKQLSMMEKLLVVVELKVNNRAHLLVKSVIFWKKNIWERELLLKL